MHQAVGAPAKTALFAQLGCRFEHARCLELAGDVAGAGAEYQRLGAIPALTGIGE